MPVYNGEREVADAIESILAQTYTDFEFVIIDDGSTDASRDVIRTYSDPRIVLLCNERNMGVSASLNRGLALARGELIARQDADDLSLPHRLETQVAYLDAHRDVGLVGSGYYLVSTTPPQRNQSRPTDSISIKWKLLFGNQFTATSVIFRRHLAMEGEGFQTDDRVAQDYGMWSLMAHRTQLANMDQPLVCYRPTDRSITVQWPDHMRAQATRISTDNIRRLVGDELSDRNLRLLQLLMTRAARRESPEQLACDLLVRGDDIKSAAAKLIAAFSDAHELNGQQRRALEQQVYPELGRRILAVVAAHTNQLERAVLFRLYATALAFSPGLVLENRALRIAAKVLVGSRGGR